MAKSKKTKNNLQNILENKSIRFDNILAILLLSIIFISTIFQGLLFEIDYINTILLLGFLALVFLIVSLLYKEKIQWRSYTLFLSSGFAIAYVISLFNAAYTRSAVLALSKYLILVILVLLIINLKQRINLAKLYLYGFYITGVGIAVLGLDAIWGSKLINGINNLVAGGQVIEGQEFLFDMILGNRLASVFQYPNTTGAFLLVAWLIGIGLWLGVKNKVSASALGAGSILSAAAFILTLSRGAYLMAIPLVLLALILMPKSDRLSYGVSLLGSGLAAAIIGIYYAPAGAGSEMGSKSWLISIAISLLFGFIITYIIDKIDHAEATTHVIKKSRGKYLYSFLIIIVSMLTIAGSAAIWFLTEPINLTAAQPIRIVRNFSLDQTGDFSLELSFEQPIDEELAGVKVYLDSQNQKEVVTKKYNRLLNLSLQDAVQSEGHTYTLPFELVDEKSIEQRLIIQGKLETSNNQITGLRILDASTGEQIKALRLERRFLSEAMGQRIESILLPSSSYSRFAFYYDGIEIIKDYPLTGAGGGGWEHLYNQYQAHKYVSRDIHSYGFQLMIEVGLLGLLLIIALAVLLIHKLVDLWLHPNLQQLLLWLGAVGILGHSMIDFDFAFFSLLLIFWTFIALLDFSDLKVSLASKLEAHEKSKQKAKPQSKSWLVYTIFIGLTIASMFWPFRINLAGDQAGKYTIAAINKNASLAEAHIRKAIAYDPLHADYKVALAKLLVIRSNITQSAYEEGNLLVTEAKEQAWNNYLILENISGYYQKSGQWAEAHQVENRITTIRPLTPLAWQNKGTMIQNALAWYENPDNQAEDKEEQLNLWLQRGLAIPEAMAEASADKLQEVKPTKELQALIDAWTAQLAALE